MLVLLPSYLVWHGELEEVESVGVPLHDDLLQVLQVLKDLFYYWLYRFLGQKGFFKADCD